MRYINERYFQCFLKERGTAVISNRGHEENKKQETVGLHFFLHISLLTWDLFFLGPEGRWAASSTLKLEGQPQEGALI